MKAVTITTANQDMLASRYLIESWDKDERLPIGYILIADFGNEHDFDVIMEEKFNNKFTPTGEIENGFVSIVRK